VTSLDVTRFGRAEFLNERWDYSAGEHVTILGPTNSGKTTLGYQLLDRSTDRDLPGVVLVLKPRDATVQRWTKALGYRRVRTWPPPMDFARPRPRGYVLWPKHTLVDPEGDDARLQREMQRALRQSYSRGDRVLFADEVFGLTDELKLSTDLVRIWSRGRSMGCGLWAASQKPTHIPLWAYSQAEHLFLHHDPDKRARDRYKEIGGVDPDLVADTVVRLPRHHFLYIRRRDAAMCVIGK
jgi:hypothetical protein